MTHGKTCPLMRALSKMLPGAIVYERRERAWHSATFSGSRIKLSWKIPADFGSAALDQFRNALPEQMFELPQAFVADIAISGESSGESGLRILEIEALVLDE
jgi:hypothetical protein